MTDAQTIALLPWGNGRGHLMRSVILAHEAVTRGLKVVVPVLDSEQAGLVESTGAIAVPYPRRSVPEGLWDAWASQEFVEAAIREDVALFEDYAVDTTIHDGRLSANIAAHACGVASIGLIQHIHFPGHTYAGRGIEPLWPKGADVFNVAASRYGIFSDMRDLRDILTASPIAVPSIPELDPMPISFDAEVTYVGPITGFAGLGEGESSLPTVTEGGFIFYKTVQNKGQTQEFATAFADVKEHVFIATGSEKTALHLRRLPELQGFSIASLWNLAGIRGKGCSAVTHGGHGTALTFLQAGLPAVVLPDDSPERQANARHLREMGASMILSRETSSEWDWSKQGHPETVVSWHAVREACEDLRRNNKVQDKSARIADRLAQYTVPDALDHMLAAAAPPRFSPG